MSLKIKLFEKVYKERDFSFLIFSLSLFLLPLSMNLSTIGLVLAIVLKLVQVFSFKHKLFYKKTLKLSSIIGSVFFIYIILNSIIQSNLAHTFKVFDEEFSHLVLLFLIPMLLREKKENKLLSFSLILGLITACTYVFIGSFFLEIDFNKYAFLEVLNIHHTYLSIYTLFFVNILLSLILNNKKIEFTRKKLVYIVAVFLSFLLLFVLGSKVSMVIYFVLIGFYSFKHFSKKKQFYFFLFFLPILITCFLVFSKNIDTSYKSALNFRIEIWKESVNSIIDNPIFGNLKMNEKDVLNFYHYKSGKYYLMDSDLNSHNQFLSFLLKYGIVGCVILFLYFTNGFVFKKKSISNVSINQVIGFATIMIFTFYIENVFDRHHGIVFFSVFFNYYLIEIKNEVQ